MLSDILDDLRFAARKASRKDLLKTAVAFNGLAAILGIAGVWLLSVGFQVGEIGLDGRLHGRAAASGEALTLMWILSGAALVGLALLLGALGIKTLVHALSQKPKR